MVKLTERQHKIAHWMLWKTYGGSQTIAFFRMGGGKSSRGYQQVKEAWAKGQSVRSRKRLLKLVEDGSHPFMQDELKKENSLKMKALNAKLWSDEDHRKRHSERASKTMKKLGAEGKHHTQVKYDRENVKQLRELLKDRNIKLKPYSWWQMPDEWINDKIKIILDGTEWHEEQEQETTWWA